MSESALDMEQSAVITGEPCANIPSPSMNDSIDMTATTPTEATSPVIEAAIKSSDAAETSSSTSIEPSSVVSDVADPSEETTRLVRDSFSYLFNSSWYLYSTLREKTYESSELAKYGFDQLETIAKKSQPLAEKIITAGQPVVDNLDQNLVKVVGTLHDMKKKAQETTQTAQAHLSSLPSPSGAISSISSNLPLPSFSASTSTLLPPAWFNSVNDILTPSIDISQSLTLFSTVASNAYIQLHENASRAAAAASTAANTAASSIPSHVRVEYADFLESVRSRLGRVWSSSFAVASSAAFAHLQARMADLSSSTSAADVRSLAAAVEARLREYEQSISAAVTEGFRSRFTSPALALYNVALENYTNFSRSRSASESVTEPTAESSTESSESSSETPASNRRPSLSEFLAAMRSKLGESYSQLEAPLKVFHEKMSSLRDAEVARVSAIASSFRIDQAGKLCLHDVYFSSKNMLESMGSYLNNKYADILATTASTFDYYIPAETTTTSPATANVNAEVEAEAPFETETEGMTDATIPTRVEGRPAATSASTTASQPRSLSEVGAHISRRLRSKLSRRLAPIRSFGSEGLRACGSYTHSRVRQVAGEDIVQRAEAALAEVDALARRVSERVTARAQADISAASASSSAVAAAAHARFEQSVLHARTALGELRDAMSSSSAGRRMTSTAEAYKPSLTDLKERLERAAVASRDLVSASAHYALRRELQAVPMDALDFVAQGVPMIINVERAQRNATTNATSPTSSPTVVVLDCDGEEVETLSGHQSAETRAEDVAASELIADLENTAVAAGVMRIHGLVEALKDVILWSPRASPVAAPTAVPVNGSTTGVPLHGNPEVASAAISQPITSPTSAQDEDEEDVSVDATTAVAVVESEIQRALENEIDSSSEDDDSKAKESSPAFMMD